MRRFRPKCKRVSLVNNDYRGANIRNSRIKVNSPFKYFFFAIVFFWQNPVPLVIHYSPSMFIFLFLKKVSNVDNQTQNI